MENEAIINFCWFMGGALMYKISSYIFAVGSAINLFTDTVVGCLQMLKKIDEQVILFLEEKNSSLDESKITAEDMRKTQHLNSQAHNLWRAMMIGIILSSCPSSIRNALKFKDWNSAMNMLNK